MHPIENTSLALGGFHHQNIVVTRDMLQMNGSFETILAQERTLPPQMMSTMIRAIEQAPAEKVVIRIAKRGRVKKDYRFTSEAALLRGLAKWHIPAPRLYQEIYPKVLVTSFINGESLTTRYPPGTPVETEVLQAIMHNMYACASIQYHQLKQSLPFPKSFPDDGETTDYLERVIAHFTQSFFTSKRKGYQKLGYDLYAKLGIPSQPLDPLFQRLKQTQGLGRRRFGLMHSDRHEGNMKLIENGTQKSVIDIDWELGGVGDPLYDLVIFLRRSHLLSPKQIDWCVNRWLQHVLPTLTDDVDAHKRALQDLKTYQMHEEIKDVLVDIYFLQRQLLLRNIEGVERKQWLDMVATKLNSAGIKHWGWKKQMEKAELSLQLEACNQHLSKRWFESLPC